MDPEGIFRIEPSLAGRGGLARSGDPPVPAGRPAARRTARSRSRSPIGSRPWTAAGSPLRSSTRSGSAALGSWPASPVGPSERGRYLTPDSRFELVLDAPVDSSVANRSVYLEFDRLCRAPGVVRLRVEEQRAITPDDRWDFREAGGWDRDRAADPLRRVVRLAPRTPLPRGCRGPSRRPGLVRRPRPSPAAAMGALDVRRLPAGAGCCSWGGAVCPTGPLTAHFGTPVRGAEVLRRVSIRPAVKFSIADTADAPCRLGARGGAQAADRVRRSGGPRAHRCLRPEALRQPRRDHEHHGLRARDRLSLRAHAGRAPRRPNVRAHLRQRGHARGAGRADPRLARAVLPRPERMELARALAVAAARRRAAPHRGSAASATGYGSTACRSIRRRAPADRAPR